VAAPTYSPSAQGFFGLSTAEDLLEKLRFERDSIVRNPQDPFTLFNFFVTAYHIAEWAGLKHLQRQEPLLEICGHLANGVKHFRLDGSKHTQIRDTKDLSYVGPDYCESDYVEPDVIVVLAASDHVAEGTVMDVRHLANRLVAFWEQKLSSRR
jgi:hypothetical protein